MSHLHDNLPARYASEKKRGFDWPFQDSCNLLGGNDDYKLDLSRRYLGAGVSMIRFFLALTIGSRKSYRLEQAQLARLGRLLAALQGHISVWISTPRPFLAVTIRAEDN